MAAAPPLSPAATAADVGYGKGDDDHGEGGHLEPAHEPHPLAAMDVVESHEEWGAGRPDAEHETVEDQKEPLEEGLGVCSVPFHGDAKSVTSSLW